MGFSYARNIFKCQNSGWMPFKFKMFLGFCQKFRHLSSIEAQRRMHFIDRPFSENKPQRYIYTSIVWCPGRIKCESLTARM